MAQLYETLRTRRLQLGLSQEEIAHRASIDQKQLSAIELGRVDPKVSIVVRLAAALDLEVVLTARTSEDA